MGSICLILTIALLVDDIYSLSVGYINNTTVRFWFRSIFFLPVALYICLKEIKKFLKIYNDYKYQHKETKDLFLISQRFDNCIDRCNGAYKIYRFSDKKNGDFNDLIMYRKSLMYDEFINGCKYKVTYYKNSKILEKIEPIKEYECAYKKRSTPIKFKGQKTFENQTSSCAEYNKSKIDFWFICNFITIILLSSIIFVILYLLGFNKYFDEVFSSIVIMLVGLLGLQILVIYKFVVKIILLKGKPSVARAIVTILGIPVENKQNTSANQRFTLKAKNSTGKKLGLYLYSTNVLGLGDLKKRPGYMGYGNFIGSVYEVEYYKISHVVKSMKLISQPNETNQTVL